VQEQARDEVSAGRVVSVNFNGTLKSFRRLIDNLPLGQPLVFVNDIGGGAAVPYVSSHLDELLPSLLERSDLTSTEAECVGTSKIRERAITEQAIATIADRGPNNVRLVMWVCDRRGT